MNPARNYKIAIFLIYRILLLLIMFGSFNKLNSQELTNKTYIDLFKIEPDSSRNIQIKQTIVALYNIINLNMINKCLDLKLIYNYISITFLIFICNSICLLPKMF
jgi:hypothetical protein